MLAQRTQRTQRTPPNVIAWRHRRSAISAQAHCVDNLGHPSKIPRCGCRRNRHGMTLACEDAAHCLHQNWTCIWMMVKIPVRCEVGDISPKNALTVRWYCSSMARAISLEW